MAFSIGELVYLYELDIINSRFEPMMTINLLQYETELHLMKYTIQYFDFMGNFLVAMTTNGDFVTLHPQEVYKPDENLNEYMLRVNRIDRLIKF